MSNRKLRAFNLRVAPIGGKDNGRTLRFIGSTNEVARDGGIIDMDGWETEDYLRNPVFLWAHDSTQPPIGRTKALKRTDRGLEFDVEFASKEVSPFADLVFRLYKAGFMSAVSVGFDPKEMRPPNDEERERGAYWVATRTSLLELSGVPVGADPNALKVARSVVTRADVGFLRGMGVEPFVQLAREATMDLNERDGVYTVQVRNPDDFPEGTEFHEVDLGDGVKGVAGELDGEVVLQGIAFPEDTTEDAAREWMDANGDGLVDWRAPMDEEEEDEATDSPPADDEAAEEAAEEEDEEDEEGRVEDSEDEEDAEDAEDEAEAMAAIVADLRDLADLVEATFTRILGRGTKGEGADGEGGTPRAHKPTPNPGAEQRLMDLARKYAGEQ